MGQNKTSLFPKTISILETFGENIRLARQLMESDYLLEVHDSTRMGALRFKLDESGDFVSHDSELPAPPWTSLRELEAACRHYEEEAPSDSEHEKWRHVAGSRFIAGWRTA